MNLETHRLAMRDLKARTLVGLYDLGRKELRQLIQRRKQKALFQNIWSGCEILGGLPSGCL